MSSSPDINSLSGLATVAISVEALLCGEKPVTKREFFKLQDDLKRLESSCPKHEGVVNARVRWFEILLDNFEEHVVVPIEKGYKIDMIKVNSGKHRNSKLFTDRIMIGIFVQRVYLKNDFPRLYQRVLNLYDRVGSIQNIHKKNKETQMDFISAAGHLRKRLINGTL